MSPRTNIAAKIKFLTIVFVRILSGGRYRIFLCIFLAFINFIFKYPEAVHGVAFATGMEGISTRSKYKYQLQV